MRLHNPVQTNSLPLEFGHFGHAPGWSQALPGASGFLGAPGSSLARQPLRGCRAGTSPAPTSFLFLDLQLWVVQCYLIIFAQPQVRTRRDGKGIAMRRFALLMI